MFGARYFGPRYFAAKFYASGTESSEGSLYGTVSAAALAVASLSAAGWAEAGLLGGAFINALLTESIGSAATIFGTSSLTAELTNRAAEAVRPSNIIVLRHGFETAGCAYSGCQG
jgi:hypothetical protein